MDNINRVRESSSDGKQGGMKQITGVADQGVVNQLALNTALLEGCRGEMEAAFTTVINS